MALVDRFSYSDQEKRFVAACEWVESMGVPLNKTRASEYRALLHEMADHHSRGDIDALLNRRSFPHLINAIVEGSEFIDIHRGLCHLSRTDELASRLRSFVGGAAILADETAAANRPRNIGFELFIAASASRGGLPVELNAPADISIPLEPLPFYVECKRPFRQGKVQNRIRGGLVQLARRYEASERPRDARGFLAVSVSKLVNDGSYMLRVPSENAVDAEVNRIFDGYIARYQRYWRASDRRTAAVLLELRTPCHIVELSLLTIVRFFAFAMIAAPGSTERREFEPIEAAFLKVAKKDNPA